MTDVKPEKKTKVVVILGPTAAGKTEAALTLVPRFGGEVISADSMQVYRYMDIGTAKPGKEEKKKVVHHLIDIVDPDEEYSAARFAEDAQRRIEELNRQGKIPFVVGGTGLYIDSLLGGLLDAPAADRRLRAAYKKKLELYGSPYLHELLRRQDENAAARIHPHDAVRIIRALEVLETTGGSSIVTRQKDHGFGNERYEYLKIGLTMERSSLFERIGLRTSSMIREGLIGEVEELIGKGYGRSCTPLQSFSYRRVFEFIEGRCSIDEMTRTITRDTRHYAKRQLTWFKRDGQIRWFQPAETVRIGKAIENFLFSSP